MLSFSCGSSFQSLVLSTGLSLLWLQAAAGNKGLIYRHLVGSPYLYFLFSHIVLQINTGAPLMLQIFMVLGEILYVVDSGFLKVFEIFYTVTSS